MTRVAIGSIAAGGDGVGRLPDGRAVFVPRAAPGDELDVSIAESKARFARARIESVAVPAPARIEPPCPHYTRDHCGGCQLQHLEYRAQLEAKRKIVGDALRRIGGRNAPDPEIVPSPAEWRYRSKLTLAARLPVIGLHVQGSPDLIFPLVDCLITAPELMEAWERLRPLTSLLPAQLESLVLRLDREAGVHVIVVGGSAPWDAKALAAAIGMPRVSIWWRPAGGAARVLEGPRTGYPALAFEQVNPPLAAIIRADVVAALGDVTGLAVWDLFGGTGDTARLLAARGARVWSVDSDRTAIEWAEGQAAGEGAHAITYIAARAEDVLSRLPSPDVVIVNPPRTGLDPRITTHLAASARDRPARLCYVSCDPATLARDLKRMPSLEVRQVRAYDLFPQTAHVETLVVLDRQ